MSDNDLILKLAVCNVIPESIEVLGIKRRDVYVLSTAERVIGHGRVARKYPREAVGRALELIRSVRTIDRMDEDEQAILSRVPNIDPGEAVLFTATKTLKDYLVATGDKKSLQALAGASTCGPIQKRMAGRVICLEQIVLRLLDQHDFEWVHDRVGKGCACDTCLQHAFAGGNRTTEMACRQWLGGYVSKLRSSTGSLLIAQ